MRLQAEDLTPDERERCRVFWNGHALQNCIAVDVEAGWADVIIPWESIDSQDDLDAAEETGAEPVHRIYGRIELRLLKR